MLVFVRGKVSDRKLRLFAAACCRRIWPLLVDARSRNAVEAAERYAEGRVSREEWEIVRREAVAAFEAAITPDCRDANAPRTAGCAGARAAALSLHADGWAAAAGAAWQASNAARRAPAADFSVAFTEAGFTQAELFRDVVGNPFHQVSLDPSWLTWNDGTVPRIAQAIYNDRSFHRMPMLADALAEAGCMGGGILVHCREPRDHVPGCWVLDLLLGKT
jgi:hypothetical protein